MKTKVAKAAQQPAPFTPGITKAMVRQHAYVLHRDKLPDHPLTRLLGVRPNDVQTSIVELLLRERQPADGVRRIAAIPNLHLITGAPALAQMDEALRNARQPERRRA